MLTNTFIVATVDGLLGGFPIRGSWFAMSSRSKIFRKYEPLAHRVKYFSNPYQSTGMLVLANPLAVSVCIQELH